MTEIEQAEATLAKLEDKRRHLVQRATELEDERNKIAFAAHVEGEPKSVKRLDVINTELAKLVSEQGSILAAITEAQSRLDATRQAEAIAADHVNALALREHLAKFKEHAARSSMPTTRSGTR